MADKLLHIHDELLGYVPRAGFRGTGLGGVTVTIDADGLRSAGGAPVSDDDVILAVGDSYTYGEDVGDTDSWPAQLQKITRRRVLNGGVSGYGFDQIVLRTELLAAMYAPSVIVLSFIADDLRRTEMRRLWWYDKPWFEIDDDRLVLKGVPVPSRTMMPLRVRRQMERILFELPSGLQHLIGYHARVHPPGAGQEIVRLLVERLARLQTERRIRIVLMAQYDHRVWIDRAFAREQGCLTQAVLDHGNRCELGTLDTFRRLAAEPQPLRLYGTAHMNRRGNQVIGHLLAAALPGLQKS